MLAWSACAVTYAADGSVAPPFRYYTVADGLTQSEVYDIAQDRAGYLWFTTARGLNQYDGKDFFQYTIADGLPRNTLTALIADADNCIWVGDAQGGITVLQGGRIEEIIDAFSDDSTPILDIDLIAGRAVAIAEGLGILEIDGDPGARTMRLVGDAAVGATEIAVHDDVGWVASATGLYRLSFEPEPRLVHVADGITNVHADANGRIWLVDARNRIGIWNDDRFEVRAFIDPEHEILSLATDRSGTVWATASDALFSFDGNGTISPHIGMPVRELSGVDEVTSVFVDREDTLWLSSDSRLIRFLGDRFRHFHLRTDDDPQTIWSFTQDADGFFWFGTQDNLLYRDESEKLVVLGEDAGVPAGAVRDLVTDANGTIWFSVAMRGLYRLDGVTMTATAIEMPQPVDILDIELAADGAIWFTTGEAGVFRLPPQAEELQHFPTPQGTSSYTIAISPEGDAWYGADEVGVVRLEPRADGSYAQTIFDQRHGLGHLLFNHILLTGPDEAWVATEEGGLYRMIGGRFANYGMEMPFSDQTVYLVAELDNGTVVVGGEQGLYQFVPGEFGVAHYNQLSGFMGLETNVHSTFFDADDQLWIGTVDGASRMNTRLPMPQIVQPTPTIISMESQLDRVQIDDGSELNPGGFGLNVEFAAVSLSNPQVIQYSYRLTGIDDAWGPPTSNRTVSYPRVPPGNYEFMVRARYPGGTWSDEYARRNFTVLPFFWQQPWFVLGAIVLFILALRAAMLYRTRHMEWLNDTLRDQVEERTRYIERAKEKLEESNRQLSREIEERRKSDKARAEVETRFRRAFENAPIGMGLMDAEGQLFDANPALQNMLWPTSSGDQESDFVAAIDDTDRARFIERYAELTSLTVETLDDKLTFNNDVDEVLQTVVNLSAIKSDTGQFLYSVLQIQDVTESMKLTVQLEYQASYDELTGLLNRRAFEAELERAWDRGPGDEHLSYLMFMDLDNFKVVNDTSGHVAGDQLLRSVSEILLDSVRANDIVSRLGGDEFGIILWNCPPEVAKRIAESIRKSIDEHRFHWDSEIYRIGVSIGGLPIDRELGDINELQQLADAACYAAKEEGRNRVHMIDGDKDSARVHRGQVRWVQRLRDAMENNRFAIYAQTIRPLDESLDEPERLEILLRLRDPETRRLIPPGAFLPAAERYGLSVELDEWVVRSLLDTLFIHQSFQADQRTYWINLSGTSIGDKRFASFLTEAIRRSPLPPGTINFEITETAVIRSVSEADKLMSALREMGCKFALDDFGSGLSSFGYLKKLPVDYLKIDGMFIRDMLHDETDRIFVKSIIDIAHTLNMKTIAEFIENEEMLELVRDLGADYAQGFAVGRPFVLAPRFPRSGAIGDTGNLLELNVG